MIKMYNSVIHLIHVTYSIVATLASLMYLEYDRQVPI